MVNGERERERERERGREREGERERADKTSWGSAQLKLGSRYKLA